MTSRISDDPDDDPDRPRDLDELARRLHCRMSNLTGQWRVCSAAACRRIRQCTSRIPRCSTADMEDVELTAEQTAEVQRDILRCINELKRRSG